MSENRKRYGETLKLKEMCGNWDNAFCKVDDSKCPYAIEKWKECKNYLRWEL